jgi:sugar phosphate isomerase/epimerase
VYPLRAEAAFEYAASLGYDGVELMVWSESVSQDIDAVKELSQRYRVPVLSVHAPCLLISQRVWGANPIPKLERSVRAAEKLGAQTVVVHPPFRWQAGYAENFLKIVRETQQHYGVEVAVENMFPWKVAGRSLKAYSPGWDPRIMDCDAVTLDFSHAALSGQDGLELARAFGARLRHVHLCDGSGSFDEGRVFDEHLLPGYGGQPVAEVLELLGSEHWTGNVVAEVNTRKARTDRERLEMLVETLDFARLHATVPRRPRFSRSRRALAALMVNGRSAT